MPRSSRRSSSTLWTRLLLWGIPACVVLLVVGLIIAKVAIDSYLHSDSFRQFVEKKAGATLRAQCQLAGLQFSGQSVYTDEFKAHGGEDAAFASFSIEELRAEISLKRFWQHAWVIDQAEAQKVTFSLDGPRADLPEDPEMIAKVSATPEKPGWLPNRVDLDSAKINDTNLTWKDGSLRGAAVFLTPMDGGWNIAAQNGKLEQKGYPALDVQTMRLRCRDKTVFVNEAVLRQGDGTIKLTGEVEAGDHVDLQANLDNVALTPILTLDWRARLKGNVSGDLTVRSPLPIPSSGLPVSGTLRLAHGELTALPVLDQIALFTATEQFRRLTITRASGDFDQDGRRLKVTKFQMEAEGLLSIEGDFTIENSMIDGSFQVGVTPSSLQWLPGAREKVFVNARGGYLWAPMRLTGPLNKPKEDLTARLATAMGGAAMEGVENAAEHAAKTGGDTVGKGVKAGSDAVKGIINMVVPGSK